ncbi:MAG: hypothetical protein SFU98_02495 [Leptospiraceae bacterium]|nr:hypothetical protein [Leptospiraceae bacterium]
MLANDEYGVKIPVYGEMRWGRIKYDSKDSVDNLLSVYNKKFNTNFTKANLTSVPANTNPPTHYNLPMKDSAINHNPIITGGYEGEFTFSSIDDLQKDISNFNSKYGTNYKYEDVIFYNTKKDNSLLLTKGAKIRMPAIGAYEPLNPDKLDIFTLTVSDFWSKTKRGDELNQMTKFYNERYNTNVTWQQIAEFNGIKDQKLMKKDFVVKFPVPADGINNNVPKRNLSDILESYKTRLDKRWKNELKSSYNGIDKTSEANSKKLVSEMIEKPDSLSGKEILGWKVTSAVKGEYRNPNKGKNDPEYIKFDKEVVYEQPVFGTNIVNLHRVTQTYDSKLGKLVKVSEFASVVKKADGTYEKPIYMPLNHGDAITSDPSGRIKIIPSDRIADYIKENNITNAQVNVNGMDNNALDAVQAFQTTTAFRNQAAMGVGDAENLARQETKLKDLEKSKLQMEERISYLSKQNRLTPSNEHDLRYAKTRVEELKVQLEREKANLEKLKAGPNPTKAFVPTFHIFKDTTFKDDPNDGFDTNTTIPGGYFGSHKVVDSINQFIGSGAFKDGGTLTGHSAGGFNIGRAIKQYKKVKNIVTEKKIPSDKITDENIQNLQVATFGGVHDRIPSSGLGGWTDLYNASDVARLQWRANLTMEQDKVNGEPTPNFVQVVDNNGLMGLGVDDKWNNLEDDLAKHNFLTEYSDGYRVFQRDIMCEVRMS